MKWSGLNQGSLFNRPKANVLMTVVTAEGKKPLSVKNVAKYPVKSVSFVIMSMVMMVEILIM